MLRHVVIASVLVLTAACACKSAPPPPTTPEPAPAEPGPTEPGPTEPAPSEPVIDLAKLGSACGPADLCEGGTTCATYYGIAGPSGPAFKSCEIACSDKGATCPTGSRCVTIADGPGQVCRPDTVNE